MLLEEHALQRISFTHNNAGWKHFRSPFFLSPSFFPFSQDVYLFIYLDKTFQEEHKFEPLPG